jgi:hypothetical protein
MSDEPPASITLLLNLGRDSVRISTIPIPHDDAVAIARELNRAVWDFIRQCDAIRHKAVIQICEEVIAETLYPKKGETWRNNPRR